MTDFLIKEKGARRHKGGEMPCDDRGRDQSDA